MHPVISHRRRRANFRAVEEEVRYYHQLRKELAQRKQDIIEATDYAEVPMRTGPGNTVLAKVMQMRSSAVILETERRIAAVEYALQATKARDESRFRMITLKYFENRLTDEGIWLEIGIGRDTFYRWRREFVELVAGRMGWEV